MIDLTIDDYRKEINRLDSELLRIFNERAALALKIGEVKHQDIGQMQMYVNFYDREIKLEDENPTIGLILCKDKNEMLVEYTFMSGFP